MKEKEALFQEGPAPGEVHLWVARVDELDPAFEEERDRHLPAELLQKLDRLRFDEDRRMRANSSFMLRSLLSGYLERSFDRLRIGIGSKGKPFSLDDPFLHFNMSHSGSLCVVAFCRGTELGVDIEAVRPLPDMERLIDDNFRPAEIRELEDDPLERRKSFFRFWTFKEAYLKAIGEGMRLHPRHLEFRTDGGGPHLTSSATLPEEEPSFMEFTPASGYQGTLALMGPKKKLRLQGLELWDCLAPKETLEP